MARIIRIKKRDIKGTMNVTVKKGSLPHHPQDDPLFCPSCHNLTADGIFTPDDWCENYRLWVKKYE